MTASTRLGIVVAEFNRTLTTRMLKQALRQTAELKAQVTYVCKVPGSYDMPLIVQTLLEKDDVDAVVTLGTIVQGETKHDEVIAHAIADKLIALSLQYRKPVTLGVAGPGMSWRQAESRATGYANRSVAAAVKMTLLHRTARRMRSKKYPAVLE